MSKRDAAHRLLQRIETWEAKLIMEDAAWATATGLPCFTQELWDEWIGLQTERNRVLQRFREAKS